MAQTAEQPRATSSTGISERSVRKLWFQIPALLVVCGIGSIVALLREPRYRAPVEPPFDPRDGAASEDTVPNVVRSFEEEVLGRRLGGVVPEACNGECEGKYDTLMKDNLNSDFLMIKGSIMLKYRDPYECDETIIPGDTDSDNGSGGDGGNCILEIGEGRRRAARKAAREQAKTLGAAAPGWNAACGGVMVLDDEFIRDKNTLKCSKSSVKKQVCVRSGADGEVSGGALAVIREEKMIWIIWYIFGIVYMMAALAIVCDEFFVPALECFVDAFGISMDVAGATFMAAGGSMPELFTSFIATFQESEVGFVAIVGSAVFNVLFVIAVCAIASTEVLELTWWPLFRDCSFYVVALLTVAFVFTGPGPESKNKIEVWEALLLLFEYIMYCTFMKFNGKVYHFIENKLLRKKVVPVDGDGDDQKDLRMSQTHSEKNIHFTKPGNFRAGVVKLLTQNAFLYETAGVAAVTQIKGELEDTFKRLDKDNDGKINITEVKELLNLLGVQNTDTAAIKTSIRRINRTGDEDITFESFKKWYLASEARIEAEFNHVFDKLDTNKDGMIESAEVKKMLQDLGHKPTDDEIEEIMKDITQTEAGEEAMNKKASFEQFSEWYNQSMFYEGKKNKCTAEEEADEDGGLSLDMPEGAGRGALFWYVFTYPLCAILYSTLPDVRVEKWQRNAKMAIVEFALSLVWIGIFSNWLYECLVVVSNTFRIPVAVSAVTLLAGGTSVPDLLSSYVVARNGEGDMAVSSSIGSNIFDVTVGLPLPWLMYCIVKGQPFQLGPAGSKGLGFSIILLVLMLAAVICTIMVMKWRLTKTLGYVMLAFYILYVVQYLMQKLPPSCNVDKVGLFQIDF